MNQSMEILEIIGILCVAASGLLILYGLVKSIYRSVMGEQFISFNDTHRIALKRNRFYPQHCHQWERFWHHYKNIQFYKGDDEEWHSRVLGKLSFSSIEDARNFLQKLPWYN